MLTMSQTARGWHRLRWSPADLDTISSMDWAVRELALLPGVKYVPTERFIEAPQNVWGLPAWRALRARVERAPSESFGVPQIDRSTPLYDHQKMGVHFLVDHGGGWCADPMGLGKTRTAIAAAQTLRLRERPGAANLILAPAFTRAVWLRELLALGVIDSPEQFCAVQSRDPQHPSFRPEADWWFVHYDVAHAWASRLVTNRRGRPAVAILDECHWLKNPKAQRSLGAQAASGVTSARILLSGTPLPNRVGELWWPLTIMDSSRAWGSHHEFRERYAGAVYDGSSYVEMGPTHTDELRARLEHRYIRRELHEVGIDLPDLRHERLSVTFDEADLAAHASIVTQAGGPMAILDALDRGAYSDGTLSALHRLRQLTSAAKVYRTIDYLQNAISQGEPVVVFCWERATANRLATVCGADAFLATGAQSQSERDEAVRRFQAGERMILVTTYGAMREGVTLHRARFVVLHDLDWVPANILQAEARVHRIGQARPAIAVWVTVEDSFDTLLARHVVAKARTMYETLGLDAAERVVDELGLRASMGASIEDEARRLLASTMGETA